MITRFIDWLGWRFRAWSAESAATYEADFWDRSAEYCHGRAAEFRAKAARIKEAKLRRRFNHPRGVA